MRTRLRHLLALYGAVGLLIPLMGASGASAAPASSTPACIVSSAPSQVETGEGRTTSSIADVVTVKCQPANGEEQVEVSSPQLFALCQGHLTWVAPTSSATGETVDLTLDDNGYAIAIVFGGPSCEAGRALITAELTVAPHTTARTYFTILPPASTKQGVTAVPASQVEDATFSDGDVVVKVEFPSVFSGDRVEISSPQLDLSCERIGWYGPEDTFFGRGQSVKVTLDNDGNAWVAGELVDCAAGKKLITADLLAPPYTTLQTHFTLLEPTPTATPRTPTQNSRSDRADNFRL